MVGILLRPVQLLQKIEAIILGHLPRPQFLTKEINGMLITCMANMSSLSSFKLGM